MWLHLTLSERIAALFELAVAAMLLFLGMRCIVRAFAAFSGARVLDSPVPVPHTHHDGSHHHDHSHERAWPTLALARRPLTIGLVHGLAGSGALTALALSNMPSFATALVFILCFGTGSVMGMMALSGLAGVPLAQLGRRGPAQGCLFACAGVSSLVLGVLWGWPLVGQITGS
jgi:ABC-type nickel/cobalt efflux system permease component RcnA